MTKIKVVIYGKNYIGKHVMNENEIINKYIEQIQSTLGILPIFEIIKIIELLKEARIAGKRIYFIGNGGSAATASHFASDLNKGAIRPGLPRFKAIALSDNVPVMTAWANDVKYEDIFSEQLENYIDKGDIVLAISGSGNSPNIVKALELAVLKGAVTVALTGFNGGKVKDIVSLCLVIPNNSMRQIEDFHLLVAHVITECLQSTNPDPITRHKPLILPRKQI